MDQRKLKSSSFLLIGLIVMCLNLIMPAQGLSIVATNGTVASNEISGTLTCTIQDVDDLHQNYTVEWFKNDISLKGVDGFTIEQKGLVSNLTVKVIDENKVGVYLCRAEDPVTTSSDTGHPHLEAWPRVKIQLDHGEKSLTRIAGEDIEITCTVYSHPAPLSIIWLREDGSVAASQNMTKDFNNTERANGMLYMSNLNMTDRGEYSCVASNEIMGRYRVSSNETVLLRIKDPLAPLWPFIGIMAEIVVLAVIIAAYEINKRRKQKKRENLDSTEKRLIPNASGTNNADDGGDVRKRK